MSQQQTVQTALVWFRRDLRVDDNPALVAALQSASSVVSSIAAAAPAARAAQHGTTATAAR
jgi:deoxyribodipyrimidine photolyase